MSKIVTITINPAVDKSTNFNGLVAEQKIRCEQPHYDAGGGGINVSKAIVRLGGNSKALFPIGGSIGDLLKVLVEKEGVDFDTVASQAWTRENFIALDNLTNAQYRFGMPSPKLSEEEFERLLGKLQTLEPELLVISGSIPDNLNATIFKRISEIYSNNKPKIIADTSGEALKYALESGVYMIKPNHTELAKLLKRDIIPSEEIASAAQSLIAKYACEIVVISMGAKGAMLVTKDENCFVYAPNVEKKSTVGAGDSMVGGMVWAVLQGLSLKEILKWGVACGTAATMNEGTHLFNKKDAEFLYNSL